MKKNVAFLFGSGVSVDAGMPKTDDITKVVLSGENVVRQCNGNYYLTGQQTYHKKLLDTVILYLHRLYVKSSQYYCEQLGRSPNYEDLYYLVDLLYKGKTHDYEHPAIYSFMKEVEKEIKPKVDEIENYDFTKLEREAIQYIKCVVWHMLSDGEIKETKYLSFVSEALRDDEIAIQDLFTLNHDLVLEKHLGEKNINYTHGFVEENGMMIWPNYFNQINGSVNIHKLHGSINWFDHYTSKSDLHTRRTIMTDDVSIIQSYSVNDAPLPLIGTMNKISAYTNGIYADLYECFRRCLKETDAIVIAGYGFGDKGINTALMEWLDSYKRYDRKIIVINPDDELRKKARPEISVEWDKLHLITKGIKDTKWAEVKNYC